MSRDKTSHHKDFFFDWKFIKLKIATAKKKNENKNQTKNRGKNRHLFAQRISKILCRNLGTDKPLILEKHQVFSTKLISQTDLIQSLSFWNKGQSAKLSNSHALLSALKRFYGEESETR